MAESRNEKTSQNVDFARFGGILSGFVRIRREPAGARTQDPNIKSVVLYLLSYGFSGTKRDLSVLVVQMYGFIFNFQYPDPIFSRKKRPNPLPKAPDTTPRDSLSKFHAPILFCSNKKIIL